MICVCQDGDYKIRKIKKSKIYFVILYKAIGIN